MAFPLFEEIKISVVGLGYVGLPLAVAFGKSNFAPVIGFNRSQWRIDALKDGRDPGGELSKDELRVAQIEYTLDPKDISRANFIIVTVPTPVTKANQPDLSPLEDVSRMIGQHMLPGTVIVYESTVYPGVTEELCVPLLEKASGLKCGRDFWVGYSPERINPGDREHTITNTVKVVSGIDQDTLELIAAVYGRICKAGIHKAINIKTAEAEKVIENTQRDLNIALVNELSLIFRKMGIYTKDVLDAAATKWNFHKYQPGLVGGHCIGVDPYYLTHKAVELGYHPEVILAGRRINDSMAEHVADLMVEGLIDAGKIVQSSRVLILGLTFKEDIRDTRNSKIKDTIDKLKAYGITVLGHDPNLTRAEVEAFGVQYVSGLDGVGQVDGILLATLHRQFKEIELPRMISFFNGQGQGVLVDVKSWYLPQVRSGKFPNLIYKCL